MRWLGIAAFVLTLAVVTLNIIGFGILFESWGLSFGTFVAWTWPAALGAFGVLAGAVVLGIVSVRMMLRADAEADRRDGAGAERDEEAGGPPAARGGDEPGGPPARPAKAAENSDTQESGQP
ncbi:MAG: hypothetical protein DIU83_07245 [Bacillota bacterium]|nr:MAG: hypothetical protein DIU83_07245 [Bacillota bacterium]